LVLFSRVEELAGEIVSEVKRIVEQYRKLCLEAGNANTRIFQLLYDQGPLHFYQIIEKTGFSRSRVHYSLIELRRIGLVTKDEKTDLWAVILKVMS